MRVRGSRFLCTALIGAVLLGTGVASADDDPRKVRAEAVFQEGVKLQSQGKSNEALAKLRQAYEIYPSPNTLGGIARVEQAMGKQVDAIWHYREAVRNPLMHPENAEYAKRAIAQLEKQLARVDVRGPSGLVVTIDAHDYTLPLVEPLDVEPNTISAKGTLAGASYEGRATAVAGSVTTLTMTVAGGGPVAAPPTTSASIPFTEPPPVAPDRPFWTTGRVAGTVMFGVGIVGLGVGIGLGASSSSAADRGDALARDLGATGCSGASPPAACRELTDARSAQDRDATGSTVALVAGGVLAAAGAVLFIVSRPSSGSSGSSSARAFRVVPVLGAGTAGMSMSTAF